MADRNKKKAFWRNLKFKYRLVVTNENTLEDIVDIHISKRNGLSWLLLFLFVVLSISALILAFLFCIPYLFRDLLPIGHDTFFHVSRIDGLAASIKDGDFLPAIYPYKNSGFGYGSPLFYCNLFLWPFALLHVLGLPLSYCWVALILCSSWLTCP